SQPAAPESNTEVRASADAFQHPQYEQIHQMTQDYFNGVNQHDYNMFKSTLTAQRIGAMPASKFNSDFRSSHDTDIQIYRIEAAPEGRLRMMLGFTSTQDLADAPPTPPPEHTEAPPAPASEHRSFTDAPPKLHRRLHPVRDLARPPCTTPNTERTGPPRKFRKPHPSPCERTVRTESAHGPARHRDGH
ncbi:hypothetical protein ACFQ1S_44075, partial [Kibdelosporangium lantanae]